MIRTMDSNTARNQWRAVIDEAAAGAASIVITRYGKPAIAIIAYDEFAAMKDQLAVGRRGRGAIARRPRKQVSAWSHPYFNSAQNDARSVEDVMNGSTRHSCVIWTSWFCRSRKGSACAP